MQPFLFLPNLGRPHSPFSQSPLAKKLHTAELDSREENRGEGSFPRAEHPAEAPQVPLQQVPPKPPTGLDLCEPPKYSSWLPHLGSCFPVLFAWFFVYDTRSDSAVQVGLELIAILLSQPHAGYSFCHPKQLSFVPSCGNYESKVPSS